jgi:hypothetical protein
MAGRRRRSGAPVEACAPTDTLRALQVPAERAGRPMQDDAACVLADASGSYATTSQLPPRSAPRARSPPARSPTSSAERPRSSQPSATA